VTVTKPEHQVVISGVGQSDVGRRLNRDPLELTLDACLAAIEDAGLTTADIDGISTYPGPRASRPDSPAPARSTSSTRCG
jgi:acetyl-CoA acetyltransferase